MNSKYDHLQFQNTIICNLRHLKYYSLVNAETMMITPGSQLRIPWPAATVSPTIRTIPPSPSSPVADPLVSVPRNLIDQFGRGGLVFFSCIGSGLSLEDSGDAVIQTDILESCFNQR